MAKNDDHLEAEKLFPGDRARQDAYLTARGVDSPSSTTKTRAWTKREKKTAKSPAKAKRRRI